MLTTSNFQYYGDGFFADVDTKANAAFIAQAPAMFQAVKQLMAENERLKADNDKLQEIINKANISETFDNISME